MLWIYNYLFYFESIQDNGYLHWIVQDGKGKTVQQWLNVHATKGVYSNRFTIPKDPNNGQWRIVVESMVQFSRLIHCVPYWNIVLLIYGFVLFVPNWKIRRYLISFFLFCFFLLFVYSYVFENLKFKTRAILLMRDSNIKISIFIKTSQFYLKFV